MSTLSAKNPQRDTAVLLGRHRLLLGLLHAFGGRERNLDFQKLLFLYCQEPNANRAYEFVPYKYGAFSFTSYADRRKLVQRGLLVNDEHYWQLAPSGKRAVGGTQDMSLAAFARRHCDLRGDALVAETYRRFPYYATRSEIADRVLRGDEKALERIVSARPLSSLATHLLTIGYEGRTLESYLNTLLGAGATLLCDARRNPISRKYGFSKGTLAKGCEGVGIRYEHLPELGIASEQRRSLESQADYDALFAEYERNYLPGQRDALTKIATWVRGGERVALTCYERLPQQCHRHCVAEALEREFGARLAARHL